jgi:hypothetical protein
MPTEAGRRTRVRKVRRQLRRVDTDSVAEAASMNCVQAPCRGPRRKHRAKRRRSEKAFAVRARRRDRDREGGCNRGCAMRSLATAPETRLAPRWMTGAGLDLERWRLDRRGRASAGVRGRRECSRARTDIDIVRSATTHSAGRRSAASETAVFASAQLSATGVRMAATRIRPSRVSWGFGLPRVNSDHIVHRVDRIRLHRQLSSCA